MPNNPLTEVLPAKVRAILYAIVFVASLVFAAWQASEGNWLAFAGAVVTALTGALAGSNVQTH